MFHHLRKKICLSSDPNELCHRLKLLLQKNKLEKILTLLIVALADKLLNCKSISTKQHGFLLHKGLNQMKLMKLIK